MQTVDHTYTWIEGVTDIKVDTNRGPVVIFLTKADRFGELLKIEKLGDDMNDAVTVIAMSGVVISDGDMLIFGRTATREVELVSTEKGWEIVRD